MQGEEFKQLIYNLMLGEINLEEYPVKESLYIENEFCEGKICDTAYLEICTAKQKLCEKIGVDEDTDIESIIDNYEAICYHLCMKMFEYGVLFSEGNKE